MRVLRLDLGGDLGEVDLHPFVTVLHHLGASRQRFLAAIRGLAQGQDPAVAGLVEHQGLLLELTPGAGPALRRSATTDVVVDVESLRSAAQQQVPGLQAQLDQLERRATIDAALLEEVRADLDPTAAAELARLADPAADGPAVDGPAARAGADDRAAAARSDVQAALAAWRAQPPTVTTAEPWVLELSERLDQHRRSGSDFEAALERLDRRIEAASRRLATTRAALHEAEAAATPVLLSEEEENRLSELATRPVGRGRKRGQRSRPEEEQAEIDELLARVGQPTYSAYMVYRLAPTPSAAQRAAIDVARSAVQHAEAELASATAARDDDPELEAHRQGLEELRAVAVGHLGPVLPADLAEVLALQCREVPNPERDDARRHLVWVALGHGVDLPGHADDEAVAGAVEEWLAATGPANPDDRGLDEVGSAALARRVARHRRALERFGAVEARAVESRMRAGEVRRHLASLGSTRCSVEEIFAAVERHALHIPLGDTGGSVPVVVAGSLDHLEAAAVHDLLDRLEVLVPRSQVVILTDHPAAMGWAEAAGPRRALCTGPSAVTR